MNLIIIPFHDWRKSEKEGFRTRDVQFIKALACLDKVKNILVVNRPCTYLELLYKQHQKKLTGKIISKRKNCTLTQVDNKIFVTDFHSSDAYSQYRHKYRWFIEKYTDPEYVGFIKESCQQLGFASTYLIAQNVFSHKLALTLPSEKKLFDAWDNFLKFSAYKSLTKEIEAAYDKLSIGTDIWMTNSQENLDFFQDRFSVKRIEVIKNGASKIFLEGPISAPKDLARMKRPIIGFGGKITYLLDVDLINFITGDNPQASFVFVGQILDKTVFSSIKKRSNVHFLGDKHYDYYPQYVKNFDICIVPYKIKENQHGGDSIKAYEYLLTGKKVVGTRGNGLVDLEKYLYIPTSQKEFSRELKNLENKKPVIGLDEISWNNRARNLLKIIQNEIDQ